MFGRKSLVEQIEKMSDEHLDRANEVLEKCIKLLPYNPVLAFAVVDILIEAIMKY